jgi:hypothetical protein
MQVENVNGNERKTRMKDNSDGWKMKVEKVVNGIVVASN